MNIADWQAAARLQRGGHLSLTLLRKSFIDGAKFYRTVARIVAEAMKCSGAGLWLFRDEESGRAMTCTGMFDRVRGRSTVVADVHSGKAVHLFEALITSGHIVAADAPNYPAARPFFELKMTQLDVRSTVAAAFSVNGWLCGAFSCTQIGEPRRWTQMKVLRLTRLGANASPVTKEADTWLRAQAEGYGW